MRVRAGASAPVYTHIRGRAARLAALPVKASKSPDSGPLDALARWMLWPAYQAKKSPAQGGASCKGESPLSLIC